MKILIILLTILLCSCVKKQQDNRPLDKYELSTDKTTAKAQCNAFFKKFHGKYEYHKYYGKTEKISTLQFMQVPDCSQACFTHDFYWECYFHTDDHERGMMDFTSRVFTESAK